MPAEPVQGLMVTLAAADSTWPLGTAMRFEATLKNVGRTPILVDLFGDLDEIYQGKRSGYLPSCFALSWGRMLGPAGPKRGRYTLARDQFVRLAPGESTVKRLGLTLSRVPPGTYRVRLAYTPRAASPSFSVPERWMNQQEFHEPMWIGMAFSNELTVHVVAS